MGLILVVITYDRHKRLEVRHIIYSFCVARYQMVHALVPVRGPEGW